eukprot:6486009-Amphidinium_carterae.1
MDRVAFGSRAVPAGSQCAFGQDRAYSSRAVPAGSRTPGPRTPHLRMGCAFGQDCLRAVALVNVVLWGETHAVDV